MSAIDMGTIYEALKQVCLTEKPLTNTEFKKCLREVKQFFLSKKDKYFMLLNRETHNFTLFNLGSKSEIAMKKIMDDLKECLDNRGETTSITLTESGDAFEIWIKADNDALVYYLFPYDVGVIEYEVAE